MCVGVCVEEHKGVGCVIENRERERAKLHMCVSVCVVLCIHKDREREIAILLLSAHTEGRGLL